MVKMERASTAATSNATVNYDLPLWDGKDITSWQGNLNDAMNKIDSAIWNVQEQMNGYNETAENLKEIADQISGESEDIKNQLATLTGQFNTLNTELGNVKTDLENAKQAVVNLDLEQQSNQHMIEALQDDVGKLMNFHIGMSYTGDVGTVLEGNYGNAKLTVQNIRFIGSIMTVAGVLSTEEVTGHNITFDFTDVFNRASESLGLIKPYTHTLTAIALDNSGFGAAFTTMNTTSLFIRKFADNPIPATLLNLSFMCVIRQEA